MFDYKMNNVSFIINEYDEDTFSEIDPLDARVFMNMLARKIKNNINIEYKDLSEYIISDDLDKILSYFKENIDPKENYNVSITNSRDDCETDRELSLHILPEKYLNNMSKIPYILCFIQY